VVWDVLGRVGPSRSSIPYSIYISQFQTGTPKPRYIGFRAGGRENGTQNGQFRPVFGHILRPLPKPHFFVLFVLWSTFSGFSRKVRKVSSRHPPGRGSWDGCLEQSGAASQELLQTGVWEGCLGGSLGGSLEQLPRSCSRLPPDCHQTGAMVWSLPPDQTYLAQVRVAKKSSRVLR